MNYFEEIKKNQSRGGKEERAGKTGKCFYLVFFFCDSLKISTFFLFRNFVPQLNVMILESLKKVQKWEMIIEAEQTSHSDANVRLT